MLCLDAGALAIDLLVGVGVVELDVLDIAARDDNDLALAASFQALQDLVLDLHVPCEVVFAGLQHGARRRHRVTTAFQFDRVEIGPVRQVVGRIELALHQIARLEIDIHVRAGANR